MTDTPLPPAEETKEDRPQPLTKRALEKMRNVVSGNGIDPKKVELIGTEEVELVIQGELLMTPDTMRTQKRYVGGYAGAAGRKGGGTATQLQNAGQLEMAAEEVKKKTVQDTGWVKNAYQQLRAEQGQGWGLEDADVTMDDMAQTFFVTEMCPACGGNGGQICNACNGLGRMPCQRCQTSGRELCYACNGTGIYNNDSTTYCPVCKGATLAPCRICTGTGQVACPECRSTGKLTCATCKGDGKATLEEKITPVVHCSFSTQNTMELPSGFRRAISRGGGLQSLSRGHADITMHDVDESDPERIFIPYTARLPYADVRLRVGGKALPMTVMGKKQAILDVPNFMDARLEPDMADLEANPAQADGLKKAMKWRVMRDAFESGQKREDAKAMRRRYPFGFSAGMLERAKKTVTKIVQRQTLISRLTAGGIFIVALALVYWMALASNTRGAMVDKISLYAALAFDIIVCIATAFGGQRLLQYVTLRHLKKNMSGAQLGGIGAQKMDVFDMTIMAIAILMYLGMISLLKAPPDWLAMIGK
jgi:hypothetical protein